MRVPGSRLSPALKGCSSLKYSWLFLAGLMRPLQQHKEKEAVMEPIMIHHTPS
jgi:hypothetical protein